MCIKCVVDANRTQRARCFGISQFHTLYGIFVEKLLFSRAAINIALRLQPSKLLWIVCAIFGGNTSENTFALRLNILIDMCSWRKESICPSQAKLWYEPRRALQTYASASGSPTFYKLLTIDLRHEHCWSMCNSLM